MAPFPMFLIYQRSNFAYYAVNPTEPVSPQSMIKYDLGPFGSYYYILLSPKKTISDMTGHMAAASYDL